MEPNTQVFLEHVLTRNIVFVLFFGTLFPVAAGLTVKQSLSTGMKLALVLALAGLTAGAAFSLVPEMMPFLYPVIVMLISVAAVRAISGWGELQGEWAGMPKTILFLAPVAGLQTYLWVHRVAGLNAVLTVFGSVVGFYCGLVLIASLIEQIRIAESAPYARRVGTLFFSIAIVGLGLAGFQFL